MIVATAKQQARLLEASIADLHYQLGKKLAHKQPKLHVGEHTYNPDTRHLEGLALDCTVRACHPVDVPESAAPISDDWMETERLLDAAWKRFSLSMEGPKNKAQVAALRADYRAECERIIGR